MILRFGLFTLKPYCLILHFPKNLAFAHSGIPAFSIQHASMQGRENCSFSKHGGNSIDGWATKRTLFRGEAADLAARARATTSRCDGKSNGGGEEGDGHVQPRVRGVRERGFASPEKATNILTWIHVALPRIFRRQIAFQQVLRRAHDARPDSAAVTVRLPSDDLARYVRVPHPARPHASRARGAARSTGHWL